MLRDHARSVDVPSLRVADRHRPSSREQQENYNPRSNISRRGVGERGRTYRGYYHAPGCSGQLGSVCGPLPDHRSALLGHHLGKKIRIGAVNVDIGPYALCHLVASMGAYTDHSNGQPHLALAQQPRGYGHALPP